MNLVTREVSLIGIKLMTIINVMIEEEILDITEKRVIGDMKEEVVVVIVMSHLGTLPEIKCIMNKDTRIYSLLLIFYNRKFDNPRE